MNAKFSLKDVQFAGSAHLGEFDLSVEYTVEEFIALMKIYPDVLKALMEMVSP